MSSQEKTSSPKLGRCSIDPSDVSFCHDSTPTELSVPPKNDFVEEEEKIGAPQKKSCWLTETQNWFAEQVIGSRLRCSVGCMHYSPSILCSKSEQKKMAEPKRQVLSLSWSQLTQNWFAEQVIGQSVKVQRGLLF